MQEKCAGTWHFAGPRRVEKYSREKFHEARHKPDGRDVGPGIMSTLNAIGFVICGLVMAMLPFMMPHAFPAGSLPGGTSTLWVEFMGWVNGLIGGMFLVIERGLVFVRHQLVWNGIPPDAVVDESKIVRPALPLVLPVESLRPGRLAA
jgi:hypothetical protein